MKILFFIESLCAGGKERRVIELISGLLQNRDIKVGIVLMNKNIHYKKIFDLNVNIYYAIRKYTKKDPLIFTKFYQIAKEFNPDIIHVWGKMSAFYAIPTKLILGKPMLNNEIASAPSNIKETLFSRFINFPFSNKIIANSKAGLNTYKAPFKKSIVIYNGFNFSRLEKLREKEFIKDYFKINTPIVIGMVATFSSKKDYSTYISAANLILENRPDITFLCIGDGNSSYFESMVPKENKKNILFLGKQSRVEEIMNICNIGVLTSFTEGIPNTILEFMSLGKPVIVTKGGGTEELVKDNLTGFIIKPKDTLSLVNKINKLLDNTQLSEQLGNNGKNHIEHNFSLTSMVSLFLKIYKEYYEK